MFRFRFIKKINKWLLSYLQITHFPFAPIRPPSNGNCHTVICSINCHCLSHSQTVIYHNYLISNISFVTFWHCRATDSVLRYLCLFKLIDRPRHSHTLAHGRASIHPSHCVILTIWQKHRRGKPNCQMKRTINDRPNSRVKGFESDSSNNGPKQKKKKQQQQTSNCCCNNQYFDWVTGCLQMYSRLKKNRWSTASCGIKYKISNS